MQWVGEFDGDSSVDSMHWFSSVPLVAVSLGWVTGRRDGKGHQVEVRVVQDPLLQNMMYWHVSLVIPELYLLYSAPET